MTTAPPARLFDITRLVSRAGRVLTGVDRVERAYLRALLGGGTPVFGIIRTPFGFILLSRSGLTCFAEALDTGAWGGCDGLSRLARRLDPAQRAAQSLARRNALDRCRPAGLARMLARHLPAGTAYLNTGHSNLTDIMLTAMRAVPQARMTVLIHDTIPLDLPHLQRPGAQVEAEAKLRRAALHADLIICTSATSRADVTRHMIRLGRLPPLLTAHLGVDPVQPDRAGLPEQLDLVRPYFVTVGTIEPRKNHALLLDIWDSLGTEAPNLLICGSRGWRNAGVFERLDRLRDTPGARVIEVADLGDAAIAALLQGSRGLLFPSLAEGFGLPPIEAAALGVPVLCGDLAVYRETLGDRPVYLDLGDPYHWKRAIGRLASDAAPQVQDRFVPPDWDAHFKIVLKVT